MKNPLVSGFEAKEIDAQVAKLLRDLGNPEPPLRLEVVRDRLQLDLQYYSSTDHSFVRDTVHAVKVAGKQILRRPSILIDAIKQASLRALLLPDRKRILIDSELPKLKHRWAEGHEIGHDLTPWHKEYLLGDSEDELSPACHATIEAEANYACGQLLFLQERFVDEMMSLSLTIDSVNYLADLFGNTRTSTLWRLVEQYRGSKPIVGIVSCHPIRLEKDFDAKQPCRHVIQSPVFRQRFSNVTEIELFSGVQSYCGSQSGGPLGDGEVLLRDDNGAKHVFQFETFHFFHYALTMGVHAGKLVRTAV